MAMARSAARGSGVIGEQRQHVLDLSRRARGYDPWSDSSSRGRAFGEPLTDPDDPLTVNVRGLVAQSVQILNASESVWGGGAGCGLGEGALQPMCPAGRSRQLAPLRST